jgi:hypothetical protein
MNHVRAFKWVGIGFAGLLLISSVLHWGLHLLARPSPPQFANITLGQVTSTNRTRRLGRNEMAFDAELTLSRLVGSPEEIGFAHTKLHYESIVETERRFYSRFRQYVPRAIARTLLLDLAQFRFYDVDESMSLDRRRELAAMASALTPDPFFNVFPTYQRLVYLNAIYDISLSFEHSPLLGCTTFFVSKKPENQQNTLLARNFDFEVDPVFDEKKTLFVVKESGKIPYVSLSWPGLIGSVTGINQRGVAMVVHGGRAGELSRTGEPVLHVLRDVLSKANNVEEAVLEVERHHAMVSHVLIIAEPSGRAEVLERVPGRLTYRYRLEERAAVTNHLTGPSANDPKNRHVIERTTTVERQRRANALLKSHPTRLSPTELIDFLRDRNSVDGHALPLGDRRAINALIAAHGVVFDLTDKRIWVGGTPTLIGQYYELSLDALFDENTALVGELDHAKRVLADPLLYSAEYVEYRKAHAR